MCIRDRGIDSIKRVEILAAIRERAPGLPEVEPAHMASLRTLRAIVAFLRNGADGAEAVPASDGGGVARLVPCAVAAPAVGLAMPGLIEGRIAVTDDGAATAQ